MRGVYSVAVLSELHRMGYGHRFLEVIGTSAGALNATYFLAGHPEDGIRIYTDFLSGNRFIRFTRPQKILDIDYLVDDIICGVVPLQEEALLEHPAKLWIALTTAQGETIWKTKREPWPIAETLRAAAAMPIAYPPVLLGDEYYLDGGVAQSLALSYAESQDPQNILLVLTRPLGVESHPGALQKRVLHFLLQRSGYSEGVRKKLLSPDYSLRRAAHLARSDARVWTIAPSAEAASRFCRSREILQESAALARADTQRAVC